MTTESGAADLDGIADVWSMSYPFLVEYNSSNRLDMNIDAMIRNPWGGSYLAAHANLGDIDGSGIPAIALAGENRIVFYHMSRELRNSRYEEIDLPAGTGRSAAALENDAATALHLESRPNPARNEIELRWNTAGLAGPARITLYSAQGRELTATNTDASTGRCVLSLAGIPHQALLVSVRTRSASATLRVAHR